MKHKLHIFQIRKGEPSKKIYSFESDLVPEKNSWIIIIGNEHLHDGDWHTDPDRHFKIYSISLCSDGTYRVYVFSEEDVANNKGDDLSPVRL